VRAVNLTHAKLEIYRLTDKAAMVKAWYDRAESTLAPTEALIWRAIRARKFGNRYQFQRSRQCNDREKITLPDLPSGLYLWSQMPQKASSKGKNLAPLAALWFMKSDFSLHALRDGNTIQISAHAARAEQKSRCIFSLLTKNLNK